MDTKIEKKKSIPNILKMLSFFLPVDSFVASLAASGYTPRPCAFSTIFVSKKKKKKMRKFKKEKEDRVCDYHEISSVYLKKKKEMISRGGELASRSDDARRTRIIKVTTPATNELAFFERERLFDGRTRKKNKRRG